MDLDLQFRTDELMRPVINIAGAVDLMSRDYVRSAGRNALEASDAGVTLDLSRVSFIDSSGLGVLVELANRATEVGKSLVMRAPSARVVRVLQLTGLDTVFTIETS